MTGAILATTINGMIYLNNAATSWPKPETTVEKLQAFWRESPAMWEEGFQRSHKAISDFFGISDPRRFIVTSGATAAINMVFSDLEWKSGDIVVTGSFEHHAIAGWEHRLEKKFGVTFKKIGPTENQIFDLSHFEEFIRENHHRISLVAFTHASNVTGDLLPAQEILDLCRKYHVRSLLDGAQTAGIVEIDIEQLRPDIFLFAGHKGPMGPHGIGGLYLSEQAGLEIPAVNFRTKSCKSMADHCDAGSTNLEGLIALASSLEYIKELGFKEADKNRDRLNALAYNRLKGIRDVVVISKSRLNRTYSLAFRVQKASVSSIIAALESRGCVIGGGFFCCAKAHEMLGTQDEGVLRISPGLFTTSEELERFFSILEDTISLCRES